MLFNIIGLTQHEQQHERRLVMHLVVFCGTLAKPSTRVRLNTSVRADARRKTAVA